MTDQNKKKTIFQAEQKYGEKIRPFVIGKAALFWKVES